MENIFALNNQVFGLNFRERRVSSKTRRAMRSEFVTPANSVEMTYDDICDVNGGGTISVFVSSSFLNGLINKALGAMIGYTAAQAATLFISLCASCYLGLTLSSGGILGLLSAAFGAVVGYIASEILNNWTGSPTCNLIKSDISINKEAWYLPNFRITL